MTTEETEVAYHEAGHAVVARLIGMPVRLVTVDPLEAFFISGGGAVTLIERMAATSLEHGPIVEMAGPIAQQKHTGREPEPADFRDDERDIIEFLAHCDLPREHYEARARALVDEHWDLIGLVAGALLARRRIGPRVLDRIMGDKRCSVPPLCLTGAKLRKALAYRVHQRTGRSA